MKSIYLRNFTAMAVLVFFCMMLICLSFVGIGRMHLLRVLQGDMIAGASEVARIAAAVGESDTLDSWLLGMIVSAVANSTDNLIFVASADGCIVRCSDKPTECRHIGMSVPEDMRQRVREGSAFGLTDLGGIYGDERYVVAQEICSEADGSCLGYVFVAT